MKFVIETAQGCFRCGNRFFHWYQVSLCDECVAADLKRAKGKRRDD